MRFLQSLRSLHPPTTNDYQRFQQLLAWLLRFSVIFTMGYSFAFGMWHIVPAGLIAVACAMVGVCVAIAQHHIRQGRLLHAVFLCCGGLFVATIISAVGWPDLAFAHAVVPLLVVTIALPYVNSRALLCLSVAGVLVSMMILVLGSTVQLFPRLDQGWQILLNAVVIVGTVALVLLLLWQFSSRLNETLTRLQEANAQLRLRETELHTLVIAIPDMLLRVNHDGRVLMFKSARGCAVQSAETTISYEAITDLLPVEVVRQIWQRIAAATPRDTHILEYQQARQGGVHDFEARVVMSSKDDVFIIIRDITERKQIDRVKSEFVSVVSHELRTPLTSIHGSLGLINGGIAGAITPQARTMIEIAYKNSERLIRLINDLLDIEKIESGNMQFHLRPLDVVPLIKQAMEDNRAYAARFGVTLELEHMVTGVLVQTDSDRFVQVLTNLLSNAAKFSPSGGIVTIRMDCVAGNVRVMVTDRGIGIPEDFRDSIFQKFAQADASDTRQHQGSGLGLSIAKAIVERCDGYIGFTSEVGVGTTFYVDLPVWRYALAYSI